VPVKAMGRWRQIGAHRFGHAAPGGACGLEARAPYLSAGAEGPIGADAPLVTSFNQLPQMRHCLLMETRDIIFKIQYQLSDDYR
jgi:hypothetical protein